MLDVATLDVAMLDVAVVDVALVDVAGEAAWRPATGVSSDPGYLPVLSNTALETPPARTT
jgi:hypothetical protein